MVYVCVMVTFKPDIMMLPCLYERAELRLTLLTPGWVWLRTWPTHPDTQMIEQVDCQWLPKRDNPRSVPVPDFCPMVAVCLRHGKKPTWLVLKHLIYVASVMNVPKSVTYVTDLTIHPWVLPQPARTTTTSPDFLPCGVVLTKATRGRCWIRNLYIGGFLMRTICKDTTS